MSAALEAVERRLRPTIMSGQVATFAAAFRQEPGIVGPMDIAVGPFEVSASRDEVIVHRAAFCHEGDRALFERAVAAAWDAHLYLASGRRYARDAATPTAGTPT